MNFIQIGTHLADDNFYDIIKNNKDNITKLILVEANPNCIETIEEKYSFINNKTIINKAVVSDDRTTINLYIPINDSTSQQISESKDHVLAHGHSSVTNININAINVNTLLDSFEGSIDLFCIDTEGYDIPIINSINFEKFDIKTIIFEYIHSDGIRSNGGPKLEECKKLLTRFGYTFSFEEYNIIAKK